jgi:DNA-directed RNA polymerase specialized sigma24 family protein
VDAELCSVRTLYSDPFFQRLKAFLRGRGLTAEDTEDVLSESLVILATKLTAGELKDMHANDRRNYAFGVARNRMLERHRKYRRERSVPIENVEMRPASTSTSLTPPISEALAELEDRVFAEGLKRLRPDDAATIESIKRGETIDDAAMNAGIAYGAMKMRRNRAQNRLVIEANKSLYWPAYEKLKCLFSGWGQ